MDSIFIYTFLAVVGAVLGSFSGASVWRLRARQLEYDKKIGEDYDKNEYLGLKSLLKKSVSKDRSQCLHCGHTLSAIDLIPLISWISLGGRCRYCKKKIGYFEPLMELGLAAFFIASYAFWPYVFVDNFDIFRFIVWLVVGVLLIIMFAYDAKWFLLPDTLMNILVVIGLFWAFNGVMTSGYDMSSIYSLAGSLAILSGLYGFIYFISKGSWIGFGDVKLGFGLALILSNWSLAFIALFAANMIGTLLVLPGLVTGKLSRMQHIPFGPLLILGFVIAFLFGESAIATIFGLA